MRLNFTIFIFIFFSPVLIFAQDFAWMTGSNTPGVHFGVYGMQGVPSASNTPGIRRDGATWHDNAGNLWLFGGYGYGATAQGNLNDLWKYTIATNQWTWVGGSTGVDQTGVYGTQGVAGSNWPGSRSMAPTWVDASGNFWMFGGTGFSTVNSSTRLNDLWKYNVTTNQWTWMKGANTGLQPGGYGSIGVSSLTNTPGAREGAVAWADNFGGLWLFGGNGYSASASGFLNDLWRYDIGINQWVWMFGSNATGQAGTYGGQNVSSLNTTPGARSYERAYADNAGNFYLFGGQGVDGSGTTGSLNDLWKFSTSSYHWTWVSGSTTVNQPGSYGTQGVASATNIPGARQGNCLWTDASGNVWLFGGNGYQATTTSGLLNDLWKYDVPGHTWTWVKGSSTFDQSGVYGAQTTFTPSNMPGAKSFGSQWTDNSGNLWLLGGNGFINSVSGPLNDLWQFGLCIAPSLPVNVSTTPNLEICSNNTVTLNVSATGTVTWYSSQTATNVLATGSAIVTPSLITTTTYYAQANTCGPSLGRTAITVTVNPLPVISATAPAICFGNTATVTASGAVSYTWQPGNLNGSLITFSPSASVAYTVSGTDANGCGNSLPVAVQVNALPVIIPTSAAPAICTGESTTLSATGGTAYVWSDGSTLAQLPVTPTITTAYTVTGTDANGCSNTAAITQTVSECTGIKTTTLTHTEITVFPNPSAGKFNLSATGELELSLVNGLGQAIDHIRLTSQNKYTAEISDLPTGVYFITGKSGTGIITKKLIVLQ
jgi:N-acetylneuraminic acid mutarotase